MAEEDKSVAATASHVEADELPPDVDPPLFPSYRRLMELPHNAHGDIMDPNERQRSFMADNVVAEFASAEHHWLGDGLSLKLEDGKAKYAVKVPFKLPNGLSLTYGQINCLAGDFYATKNPICLGTTPEEQIQHFKAAFDFLTRHERTVAEATKILELMQNEVNVVNDAIKRGEDPSVVYSTLPTIGVAVEKLTLWRKTEGDEYPTYLGVSKINLDHFGEDAHTAWQAGHMAALRTAAGGDLRLAYAMNAFADHFLEDGFAAGHMRTPRRFCHEGGVSGDGCARYMHDEDNAIGLTISPSDHSAHPPWRAYGDRRLLDKADRQNSHYCQQALQLSANAIFHAFQTRHVPPSQEWDVWRYLPDLKSARGGEGTQISVPLFTFERERRRDVEDRKSWVFISKERGEWGWRGTLVLLARSKRWKYPITVDES